MANTMTVWEAACLVPQWPSANKWTREQIDAAVQIVRERGDKVTGATAYERLSSVVQARNAVLRQMTPEG